MTRWPTPTGPTSWERPGTGGGARRVQPDAHDLLVWVARPLDGGWPNRGSGGTLTLSLVGTAVPALGPFSDHAFQGLPLHQSMSGGCAASAGTTIGQTTDWTVSAWIYVSTLPAKYCVLTDAAATCQPHGAQ